jgi:hypothetical protein
MRWYFKGRSANIALMEETAGYFRITGMGPGASEPMERIVSTALEAEKQFHTLSRICGRSGGVAIYGRGGQAMTLERVSKLARNEENAPP